MKLFTTAALVALLVAPASVSAQGWFEIQRCASGYSCVVPIPPPFPIVPTTPPPPAYLRPTPPMPLYTPPVYIVPPSGGINPWIPLMGVPPAQGRSTMETLLLLQLAAAAPQPYSAPQPVVSAPPPSQSTGAGWMSAFMKGVQ